MRASTLIAGGGLAIALGCGGLDDLVQAPPDDPPPVVEPPPEPEPEPALAAPTGDPFEDMDGWVGLAVEVDPGSRWWVPRSGGAVVSWDAAGWDAVRTGASFVALTGAGPIDLVFTGVSQAGWCSGTLPVATFAATADVPPGAVWIVKDAAGAAAVAPKEIRKATATRRLFSIPGGVEVDLQRGRTVVERGGGRPWVHTYEGPPDLRAADAPGPMWPELALTEGDVLSILFRVHGPDVVSWEWVRIDGRRGRSVGRMDVAAPGCGGA